MLSLWVVPKVILSTNDHPAILGHQTIEVVQVEFEFRGSVFPAYLLSHQRLFGMTSSFSIRNIQASQLKRPFPFKLFSSVLHFANDIPNATKAFLDACKRDTLVPPQLNLGLYIEYRNFSWR